ncbi:hypothetical protein Tco_1428043 [Tanacetum coccineum]
MDDMIQDRCRKVKQIPFVKNLRDLFKDFDNGLHNELNEVKMVFNQMEAAVEECYVDKKYFDIQKKEIFLFNDRLLEHIIYQDVINIVMHADSVLANVLPANNNYYIDEYSENLVLKVELAKKEYMIEKKFFDETVLRCSWLENRYVNIELKLQHQKEKLLNNISFNNQNAPDISEIFKINEWQAKLDAKDASIANLRKHIESLKGKSVIEKDDTPNKAKVIAPGLFKLYLEPLSLKVLKNRDAHIDYIKHTQENDDILWELVEHARALRPLNSDLDSACKYAKRIQEVLVYVTATCSSITKPSEKLVAITPLNKSKKVRNEEFY